MCRGELVLPEGKAGGWEGPLLPGGGAGGVAPGEVLQQETDAGLILGIALLGLEMNLENSGKRRQIEPAVCHLAYTVPAHTPA